MLASEENKGLYLGSIVAAGTMGILFGRTVIGSLAGRVNWQFSFQVFSLILFLLSIASLFLFDASKRKKENRLTILSHYIHSISLLKNTDIVSLYIIGFLLFFSFIGMITFLTYRLNLPPFNFSAEKIGWISFAGSSALISPFVGQISKKIGIFNIVLPNIMLCIGSVQMMGWSTSNIAIIISLLTLFLGVYSCQPLIFLLLTQRIPSHQIGFSSSLYILSCIGGGSISSVVLGPIWNLFGWEGG